jgi:hypothetical protein
VTSQPVSPPAPTVSEKARNLAVDAITGGVKDFDALLSYIETLELDARRLDVIEREAGRRISVRDESDPDICNIYATKPNDPLWGGVFHSLRAAADKILEESK